MIELRDELSAMTMHEWRIVPITVSRHKWWLKIYKFGEDGNYWFCFESPMQRRYSFRTGRDPEDGRARVTNADVTLANGDTIACYWEDFCATAERKAAVIRLTPNHIINRLYTLLDAIDR